MVVIKLMYSRGTNRDLKKRFLSYYLLFLAYYFSNYVRDNIEHLFFNEHHICLTFDFSFFRCNGVLIQSGIISIVLQKITTFSRIHRNFICFNQVTKVLGVFENSVSDKIKNQDFFLAIV